MFAKKQIDAVLDNKKQTDQRNGKDFQRVSRSTLKSYIVEAGTIRVTVTDNRKKRTVLALCWAMKERVYVNDQSGIYLLRTSLTSCTEYDVWTFYNRNVSVKSTIH